ncbi:hypothetical protein K435DRAFT_855068 [Dendrothele bispora CBS 962.96]|uniref:Uncharacterized protein n=1 Tax=Dendrothele bispora (strain CBS 962.96) TaxID=1314807 RepID=A0A4S8MC66_DENBC|nr:hypothetical protein K435DRAFT_855068 [Dendrothele bispora CBS 962.96]
MSMVCTVRAMWVFAKNEYPTTADSWLVLELTPATGHQPEFLSLIASLQGPTQTSYNSWSMGDTEEGDMYMLVTYCPKLVPVLASENVVIPPSPESGLQGVGLYDHWDNKRKALTPGCCACVRFHSVTEKMSDGVLDKFLIAESILVMESVVPWYTVCETPSHRDLFICMNTRDDQNPEEHNLQERDCSD